MVRWHRTRRFNQVRKSARDDRTDKKLERKDCGKKEDNEDFSSTDPYKMEMMLRKEVRTTDILHGMPLFCPQSNRSLNPSCMNWFYKIEFKKLRGTFQMFIFIANKQNCTLTNWHTFEFVNTWNRQKAYIKINKTISGDKRHMYQVTSVAEQVNHFYFHA